MRILVFSAHCADFCSRAGGTIAKHARAGAEVRVVALTYGERSESGSLYSEAIVPSLEQIKLIRRDEAIRAAQILGASVGFLGWGDLCFDYTQERARLLAEEIRAFRPDAILTHHGPDSQSVDHDTTAHLVDRAVQLAGTIGLESAYPPAKRAPVFYFEATVPLTELEGFNPDVYVNITEVWEVKLQALRAFERSQGFLADWYADQARLRAFQARRLCGRSDIVYAEAFVRTSPWVGEALPLSA
jgi:4-oxalomesaconate hydratase